MDHFVTPLEAQFVVENAGPPFPQVLSDEKWRVQVARIIHAMELTGDMKRQLRRRRR
jgi:hypothetical protein